MIDKKEESLWQSKVNHPKHYQGKYGMEAINVIEAYGLGFHTGNAIKYILRAKTKEGKDAFTDLKKAIWYLQRECDHLEGNRRVEELTENLEETRSTILKILQSLLSLTEEETE